VEPYRLVSNHYSGKVSAMEHRDIHKYTHTNLDCTKYTINKLYSS